MRAIRIEELHEFLDNEINKAIAQMRQLVVEDRLNQEGMIRLATEMTVLDRVRAKFHKED